MKDFLTDTTGELLITNGDFTVDDSETQQQEYLLLAEKGAYKQFPATGVGLTNFLNDEDTGNMTREIRLQFSQDGMKVQKLAIENGKLIVEATYAG